MLLTSWTNSLNAFSTDSLHRGFLSVTMCSTLERRGTELQSLGSVEFVEISVKGSQRKVAGFSRRFED
jgi:hypothetical protein